MRPGCVNQQNKGNKNARCSAKKTRQAFKRQIFLLFLYWPYSKAAKSPALVSFLAELVVVTLSGTCPELASGVEGLPREIKDDKVFCNRR
jgi:hypothetical protein